MPVKHILIALTVGFLCGLMVLIGGLNSQYVPLETLIGRVFYAGATVGLLSFCALMCCEEYALFKTKRELENFIDEATLAVTVWK